MNLKLETTYDYYHEIFQFGLSSIKEDTVYLGTYVLGFLTTLWVFFKVSRRDQEQGVLECVMGQEEQSNFIKTFLLNVFVFRFVVWSAATAYILLAVLLWAYILWKKLHKKTWEGLLVTDL